MGTRANRNIAKLSPGQRRIMEILWEEGAATVQTVLDRVASESDGDPPAYTTILTLIQKLEKAGWLTHEKRTGVRAYYYKPTQGKGATVRETFSALAARLFGGSRTLLFEHLLEDEGLTDEELAELTAFIEKRKGK